MSDFTLAFFSLYRFLAFFFFFFNDTATTEIYTLSLHDALPICSRRSVGPCWPATKAERRGDPVPTRSELLDRELRRAVRQVAHRSGGATGRGWTELAGLGTFSAALPVEAGGLHLGLVVAAALCEELGGELAD